MKPGYQIALTALVFAGWSSNPFNIKEYAADSGYEVTVDDQRSALSIEGGNESVLNPVHFTTMINDQGAYEEDFEREVVEFANLNRLSIARLNRDVHADCYITITVATTINSDGSIKEISIVETSSVPVVDRYYRYVIEQAAPFPPLARYFDPAPREFTITSTFRLDVRLWSDGIRSTRPCAKLAPNAGQQN